MKSKCHFCHFVILVTCCRRSYARGIKSRAFHGGFRRDCVGLSLSRDTWWFPRGGKCEMNSKRASSIRRGSPASLSRVLHASSLVHLSLFLSQRTLHARVCSASSLAQHRTIDSLHEERPPRRFLRPDYDKNIVSRFTTRAAIYSRQASTYARRAFYERRGFLLPRSSSFLPRTASGWFIQTALHPRMH